jgi:NTE family protein
VSTLNRATRSERPSRALVLGGGGSVGRAWQTGLAAGFACVGIRLSNADLIVGTSAGAIVGAEIALRKEMNDFLPTPAPASLSHAPASRSEGIQQLMAAIGRVAVSADPERELIKIGEFALSAQVPTEEAALARPNLAGVAGQPWPPNFQATTVSTRTGRLHVWNAASEVSLQQALAASSALPGVWPPITIGSDRYMDGGVRSTLNADIANGYNRVVVVSCRSLTIDDVEDPRAASTRALLTELDALRESGSRVEIIAPDAEFVALTNNGASLLNSFLEPDAFDMGKRRAVEEAARIREVWTT